MRGFLMRFDPDIHVVTKRLHAYIQGLLRNSFMWPNCSGLPNSSAENERMDWKMDYKNAMDDCCTATARPIESQRITLTDTLVQTGHVMVEMNVLISRMRSKLLDGEKVMARNEACCPSPDCPPEPGICEHAELNLKRIESLYNDLSALVDRL